ncbi:zinc ribbon domain-containing protein [Methanobrevibacter sp.]|uniref:zinc ribbon domain-containing protein n=1 Tax=Methanobrevibacter sp. TaxID=66852 RepID=UPI0038641579
MSKICNNCGNSVDDAANFCPYCKGQSFRLRQEVAIPDNSIVHRMFYSAYDGHYVLSRGKVTSITVFLIFSLLALVSGAPVGILFFALLFGFLTYLIFYAIRKIIGKPSQVKITHNDYGLATDLKHLLLYWQNSDGDFVIAKTKIICHLVFLAFFFLGGSLNLHNLFEMVLFGLIFEIPTFVLGFVVHKIINPNPKAKPKPVKPQKEIPEKKPDPQPQETQNGVLPQYAGYKRQLDELESKFTAKDTSVREIIEKRFEPPQLTYTRFISGVDRSGELFNKNLSSARTMIDLADEYSPRIASEIESKIEILKAILGKLDDLSNELVVNENISKKEDVDGIIGDMDNLIKSVKDYNDE